MDKYTTQHHDYLSPTRNVRLDHHDSVLSHVHQQVSMEVERLERRIEVLRLTKAPHVAVMISAYERMIEHKKSFLQTCDLDEHRGY